MMTTSTAASTLYLNLRKVQSKPEVIRSGYNFLLGVTKSEAVVQAYLKNWKPEAEMSVEPELPAIRRQNRKSSEADVVFSSTW